VCTEVNRSEEDELWGKLKIRIGNRMDLVFKYVFAARDFSDYQPVPATQPEDNFDLARHVPFRIR